MKLSDFDFIPNENDCWGRGSCNNKIARAKYKKNSIIYRVKEHDTPLWKKAREVNAANEQELKKVEKDLSKANAAGDYTLISTLESKKKALVATINNATPEKIKKAQEFDKLADAYVEYKNAVNNKVMSNASFRNRVYCADEMWVESLPNWANKYRSVEAARECEMYIPFGSTEPKNFTTLDKKEQFRILSTFAEDYEYLHSVGVIHSDIKMTNMIIGKDSSNKAVGFVIDFDAAYLVTDIRFSNPNVRDNLFGGTLMSPEHSALFREKEEGAEVASTKITTKTDVFSFAVAMYECFNGKQYFELDKIKYNGPKSDPIEMIELTNNDYFDPNGTFSLPEAFAENNAYFTALFNWMTEFDPMKRPTMGEVKTALLEYESFTNTNVTSVPKQYLPVNTKIPWDETMEFYLLADPNVASLERNKEKGDPWYNQKMKSGMVVLRHGKDLIKKGLIRKIGETKASDTTIEEKVSSATSSPDKPWDIDNIEYISVAGVTITRNERRGSGYFLSKGGVRVQRTAIDLIKEGYAKPLGLKGGVDEPWEEDGITFTELGKKKGFKRDLAKGAGFYLTATNNSVKANYLTSFGYATRNSKPVSTTSVPWESDRIRFIPTVGVTVERGLRDGRYVIIRGGMRMTVDVVGLIEKGLAERL